MPNHVAAAVSANASQLRHATVGHKDEKKFPSETRRMNSKTSLNRKSGKTPDVLFKAYMEREPITLGGILFVAVVATSFLAFGQSVGWRVVGVAQLVFTFKILRKKEVGIGWEGFRPSFYLRGNAAIITGILSLALSIMLLVYPEQTVMRWFDKQ